MKKWGRIYTLYNYGNFSANIVKGFIIFKRHKPLLITFFSKILLNIVKYKYGGNRMAMADGFTLYMLTKKSCFIPVCECCCIVVSLPAPKILALGKSK